MAEIPTSAFILVSTLIGAQEYKTVAFDHIFQVVALVIVIDNKKKYDSLAEFRAYIVANLKNLPVVGSLDSLIHNFKVHLRNRMMILMNLSLCSGVQTSYC